MSTKIPSVLVKVLLPILALGVLYGGFVGYKTYKEDADFKPYKQLAIELNNSLGGGFSFKETKRCGIDTSNCPSIRLSSGRNYKHLNDSTVDKGHLSDYLKSNGFSITRIGNCEKDTDEGYCVTMFENKATNLYVVADFKISGVGIDINRL